MSARISPPKPSPLVGYDQLARNLYVQEIPLGILTGFISAPFFMWVLMLNGADELVATTNNIQKSV